MSNIEHVERSSQQGQRRKCQRRSGPNHLHPDRRAPVLQASDGIKVSAQPQMGLSDGRQPCCTPVVDELTLEYMTQDCNSLKNQLLRLKMLLQLEDTDSPPDVPVEIEDNTTSQELQFEELIKEVQMLRAELRSRDGTIAQLTLQCHQLKQQQEQMPPQGQQIRCHCHHQRAPSSLHQGERQTDNRKQHHYDKATQTYWRSTRHTPQILQPFSPNLSEHLHQGRAVKTPPTEGHSDLRKSRPGRETHIEVDTPDGHFLVDVTGPVDPHKLSGLINTRLRCPGASREESTRDTPGSGAHSEWRAPTAMLQKSVTPAASTCPRLLQPLRLQKRVSLPALKPGTTSGVSSLKSGNSLVPLANQPRQLPPPSRGLPSFHAEPQVHPRSLCGTSLLKPRSTSRPPRDTRGTSSSLD